MEENSESLLFFNAIITWLIIGLLSFGTFTSASQVKELRKEIIILQEKINDN